VLVVGGGGREHALLWKLHRDHPEHEYLAAPGNAGTADIARSIRVDPTDPAALVRLARDEAVAFTVVGPEAPLAAGVVDALRDAGVVAFGPTRAAARLESSKAFAKELMARRGVPTARFGAFRDGASARSFARELGLPCVVKASGLAAGKGVIVCESAAAVDQALDACFVRREFGAAGEEVVVEEFLAGEECSMIAVTDGEALVLFPPSQDHKRAEDGDQGPNTGGMGAYAPVSSVDEQLRQRIVDEIFTPLLSALRCEGTPFTGCLYAGLMLTVEGPKVLEWNVRFGDPEAQALLPLLESDLLELLMAATPGLPRAAISGSTRAALSAPPAEGNRLGDVAPRWRAGACVTVVAASKGYPGRYATGAPISIPPDLAGGDAFDRHGVVVFHAGTRSSDGRLVTAGGRVLDVTAVGADVAEARERVYAALERIECPTLRWRSDIAWRELTRLGFR
jgi:phosphoribosylamine--glycine ligase